MRFLALPDKVKRSHFTAEELDLLTESSKRTLRSSSVLTDDSLGRDAINRNTSISSSVHQPSSSENMDRDRWEVNTPSAGGLENGEVKRHETSTHDRQGSVCSTQSSLPSLSSSVEGSSRHSRTKSLSRQRAMSLAPLPLPPPRLMPAIPPLPSSTTPGAPEGTGCVPTSASAKPAPATDYYKDSHARQKLRQYLASPEKFDEAVEFGFPAGTLKDADLPRPPVGGEAPDEGYDEWSAANSRDDDDEASASSPRTPPMVGDAFDPHLTHYSSVDSAIALSAYGATKGSIRSLSPNFDGREMTLRMTLTRPDLRAPEDELYAFQRKNFSGVDVETADPLALQSLPVCDDHTGAHGAFAVGNNRSPGGLKKVWKNIRGR